MGWVSGQGPLGGPERARAGRAVDRGERVLEVEPLFKITVSLRHARTWARYGLHALLPSGHRLAGLPALPTATRGFLTHRLREYPLPLPIQSPFREQRSSDG